MSIRRSDDKAYTLLTNAAATGAAVAILGGEYIFFAEGTVGGSTISLQIQSPNGTWEDVQELAGSVTVKTTALPYNATKINLPMCNVRAAITGGAASAVYAYLNGLG